MLRMPRCNGKGRLTMRKSLERQLNVLVWWNRLRHWFLAPFGRLRKPRPLIWDKYWEGSDFPICPRCGEMPHSLKACYFCGQRFTKEV